MIIYTLTFSNHPWWLTVVHTIGAWLIKAKNAFSVEIKFDKKIYIYTYNKYTKMQLLFIIFDPNMSRKVDDPCYVSCVVLFWIILSSTVCDFDPRQNETGKTND